MRVTIAIGTMTKLIRLFVLFHFLYNVFLVPLSIVVPKSFKAAFKKTS